jgi:hypothetical protein
LADLTDELPPASELAPILWAGGLPDDDKNIATLGAGLDRLRALYPIVVLSLNAPVEHQVRLDNLVAAVATIVRILDDDFETGSYLDTLLAGAGAEVTTAVRDWLRRVPSAARDIYLMIEQAPSSRRREEAETWSFCALHDLFVTLNGHGADAKLQRFVAAAVKYLGWAITVPMGDNFRLRLKAALGAANPARSICCRSK